MYSNFIYFLGAIFLFSFKLDAELVTAPSISLLFYLLFVQLYRFFCRRRLQHTSNLQQCSNQLQRLSLPFYLGALYLSGVGRIFADFSLFENIHSLFDGFGILLYILLWQVLWWEEARALAMDGKERIRYIFSSLQSAMPIILPWLFFAIILDGVTLLIGGQEFFNSGLGEICSWIFFIALMFLLFPPLLVKLWGAKPFAQSELLQHLQGVGERHGFRAKYCLWPLQGGRAYTAAVVGFLPRIRYVLFTPALLAIMDQEEIDAVLLHEIGHVKHRHILFFLYIIAGFSLVSYWYADFLQIAILSLPMVMELTISQTLSVETITNVSGSAPILLGLLLYFRFFFGFFLRNFERQADFYTVTALGSAQPLISSFEKLARYSGTKRDEKSWHHFGLGERIAALRRAESDQQEVSRHNRKIARNLFCYTLLLILAYSASFAVDIDSRREAYRTEYAEKAIFYHAKHEPNAPLWQQLKGEIYLQRGEGEKALEVWEKVLPQMNKNANLLNNVAWLLLTVDNASLRDPRRALELAQKAAFIEQKSFIFDTLATAYWAMGKVELAVQTERYALSLDPQRQLFYLRQIKLFQSKSYEQWLQAQSRRGRSNEIFQ